MIISIDGPLAIIATRSTLMPNILHKPEGFVQRDGVPEDPGSHSIKPGFEKQVTQIPSITTPESECHPP
jgi:hypothetical protein